MTNFLAGRRIQGTSSERSITPTLEDSGVSKTGCKAYYKFEETSGNLINQAIVANGFNDGLGSSADGTASNLTYSATGKLGNSCTFNGSNSSVETASSIMPSTFTTMTINAWIKPSSVRASYVVGTSPYDGNTNNWFNITTQAGGTIQYVGGTNAAQDYLSSTSSYSTTEWQMVTLVYDGSQSGSNKLKGYFNGSPQGTSTGVIATSQTQTTRLSIGKQGNSGQPFFGGGLDEVSFWNRALTSSEISTLYSGISKLQDQSRFEETDTQTMYYLQPAPETFEDTYTSNTGWTQTGSTITVDSVVSGKVKWNGTNSTGTDYVVKPLGFTLSDTMWVARFEFMRDSAGACCDRFQVFALAAGTAHTGTSNQDFLAMYCDNSDTKVYVGSRNGTTEVEGGSITIGNGTQYYCELTRLSATSLQLKLFSNSTYTSQVGSTVTLAIPADITGLTHLHHSSAHNAYGVTLTANLDNTQIYNGVTTPISGKYWSAQQ